MSRIVSRGPFRTRPRGAELWRHGPTDGNPTPAQWNGDGGNSAPFPPPFARRRRMSRSCARRHLERASRPLADALAGSRVLAHVGKTRVLMDEPHDAQGMTQRLQFALRGSKRSVRIDGVFVIVEMNSPRGTVAPLRPCSEFKPIDGFPWRWRVGGHGGGQQQRQTGVYSFCLRKRQRTEKPAETALLT